MAAHSEGKDIYERVVALETHMRGLIGNGQPGMIAQLQRAIEILKWTIIVVGFVSAGSHVPDWLKMLRP